MKGFITFLTGCLFLFAFCSDLLAQSRCGSANGYIIYSQPGHSPGCTSRFQSSRQPSYQATPWQAAPPQTTYAQPPQTRPQQPLDPLPPPSGQPTEPPPLPTTPPILPGPGPDTEPPAASRCACKFDANLVSDILNLGQQNATKINQLLEYGKVAPTADQLRQEHQRIEQLITSSLARLEDQHKRIEQEIRELYSSGVTPDDTLSQQVTAMGQQLDLVLEVLVALKDGSGAPADAANNKAVEEALASMNLRLTELGAQVEAIANRGPGAVNLTVDTPTFLEPDYVDMSLIWSQQKASGVHHAVLVVDSSAASWEQLGAAYQAARAKFPPLSLYDVRSENVIVQNLPQLVVYPKEGNPRVLSKPQEVVDQLSKLANLP